MQHTSIIFGVITVSFILLSLMGCQKQGIEEFMPPLNDTIISNEPVPLSTFFDGMYVGHVTKIRQSYETLYDSLGFMLGYDVTLDTIHSLRDTVFVKEEQDLASFRLEGSGLLESFSYWAPLTWEADSTAMAFYEVNNYSKEIKVEADNHGNIEIESYEENRSYYTPKTWTRIRFIGEKLSE